MATPPLAKYHYIHGITEHYITRYVLFPLLSSISKQKYRTLGNATVGEADYSLHSMTHCVMMFLTRPLI